MAATAAYASTVKLPGTSTATTAEATTSLGGNVYQITSAAKRILDPAVSVVVKDTGTPIAASGIVSIDYLFGKVTLLSAPGGAVTIDANYLPMLTIAESKEFSIECSVTVLDKTNFDSGGAKSRLGGLRDFSATASSFTSVFTDQDPGAGTVKLATLRDSSTPVLLEVNEGGAGYYFRGWAVIDSLENKGAVDSLVDLSVHFIGSARTSANSLPVSFGWGS